MHKYDMWIIYGTTGLLLVIIGARFVLHEIRGLVREYREFKADIHTPLPTVQQPVASVDTCSHRVSDLSVHSNSDEAARKRELSHHDERNAIAASG